MSDRKIKKEYDALARSLQSEGEAGQEYLAEIVQGKSRFIISNEDEGPHMRPGRIFSMDPGPEKEKRLAKLFVIMRKARLEAAKDEYEIKKGVRLKTKESEYKEPRKKKEKEQKKDIPRYDSSYKDFNYTIFKLGDRKYFARINRTKRNIIQHPDAPRLYDSPILKDTFDRQIQAEARVHFVINNALRWYEDNNIEPKDKRAKRRVKIAPPARRTPGQQAARAKREAARQMEADKREAVRQRKERILQEKVTRRKFIPIKNPSHKHEFVHSKPHASKHSEDAMNVYNSNKEKWRSSLIKGEPKFHYLMGMYGALENAWVNAFIAEDYRAADKYHSMKVDMRKFIVKTLKECSVNVEGPLYNPED